MSTKTLYINNLSCSGCIRKATRLIMSIPGIKFVDINLVTSKAVFDLDRDVSFEEIENSLKGTNYRLSLDAPSALNVFKKWVKVFLPLITVFTLIISWTFVRQFISGWDLHDAMHDFMGSFFLIFGALKVFNWKKFAESFQGYDPLAMRLPVYAYLYPAIEVLLGISYQFRVGSEIVTNVVTAIVMSITLVGIVKIKSRGDVVKCACLGGYFSIPITWFTVFENGSMVLMAIYTLFFL